MGKQNNTVNFGVPFLVVFRLFRCPGVFRYSGVFRCFGVPVFWSVPECSGVPVFQFSGVPVFLVLVHALFNSLLLEHVNDLSKT